MGEISGPWRGKLVFSSTLSLGRENDRRLAVFTPHVRPSSEFHVWQFTFYRGASRRGRRKGRGVVELLAILTFFIKFLAVRGDTSLDRHPWSVWSFKIQLEILLSDFMSGAERVHRGVYSSVPQSPVTTIFGLRQCRPPASFTTHTLFCFVCSLVEPWIWCSF